jgi:hypothetical protein
MTIETSLPVPVATDVVAEFPLSTTQLRCWYLDRVNPGNPSLNVAVQWELRGTFQAANLERAFRTVIGRHEILRTRFVEADGKPVQQVLDQVEFRLGIVDLRTTPETDREARFHAIAQEDAARPFDLTEAGLIRATLVRLTPDRAMVLIVVHQSCFDGYSIKVLGHEIGTALEAFETGRTPDLPNLPLQYGDFALWQQEYFATGVLEREAEYWLEKLENVPYFELDPDKPRPATRTTNVRQLFRAVPVEFGTRIEQAARRYGVSTFALGCAIVAAALHKATDAREVLFGTQIAGRNDVELEPLIGVFINNLVLRMPTDPATRFDDHVRAAKSVVEGALSNQNMPFNRLVELLNPVRDASRTPLISVNFNLQSVFLEGKRYGSVEFISAPSHAPGAIYDLNIVMIGRPNGWRMNLEYATDLFDQSTVEALMDSVLDAFDAVLDGKAETIADIPVAAELLGRNAEEARRLKDIEEALCLHPAIAEAAAVSGAEGAYAFVVPASTYGDPLETLPDLLEAHLATRLDAGTLPYGVSILAGFPRTSLGEVNRRLLKAPPRRARDAQTPAPSIDPEVRVALEGWWQEILGLETIPATSSFFDLGGHSLLVVRLLARIRNRWNVEIGISTIYEHATLDRLSAYVSGRIAASAAVTATEDWRIMRLTTEGTGTPLMAVNNAATGLALSRGFTAARPTTCIRLSDPEHGLKDPSLSFPDIAKAYAEVARAAQPEGPYLLFGNCVHGNLAIEVARLLKRDGATIAGVVMKDVWEPAYTEGVIANRRLHMISRLHDFRYRLGQVRKGLMSWSAMLGSYRIVRMTGLLQLASKLGLIDRVRNTDLEEQQEQFVALLTAARNRHRPEPVDFPLLHIVTGITPQGRGLSPSIGWDALARDRLKVVNIDEVMVHQGHVAGTDEVAVAIEHFLAEGSV